MIDLVRLSSHADRQFRDTLFGVGFHVTDVDDEDTAFEYAMQFDQAVLIDDSAPVQIGAFVRKLRSQKPRHPVIVKLAPGHERAAAQYLSSGASECLDAQMSPEVVGARLKAAIARSQGHEELIINCGPFAYDLQQNLLRINNARADLSPLQTAIVSALLIANGRPLARETILNRIYGDRIDVPNLTVVDVLVSQIRIRLKHHGDYIETIRGRGYRISPTPVERTGYAAKNRPPWEMRTSKALFAMSKLNKPASVKTIAATMKEKERGLRTALKSLVESGYVDEVRLPRRPRQHRVEFSLTQNGHKRIDELRALE